MILTKILKQLFCFKKPKLIQLSYLPVLVKDKPVLFVTWELENVGMVKFLPLQHRYITPKNTVLLAIPANLQQVTLRASNYWRKTNINLRIHTVELDEPTLAKLIDGFRPLNKTYVNTPAVLQIKNKIFIKRIAIQLRDSSIKQIDRFNINMQPIHYP